MNTFGFEIVFPMPIDSKAVISAFKTPVVVLLKIPIPLVAPAAGKLVKESFASPKSTASSRDTSVPWPELDPATPPATLPLF